MDIFLIVLIPLAVAVTWAVAHDLKRRRRRVPSVDVASRVRAIKAATQAKYPGGGDGGGI